MAGDLSQIILAAHSNECKSYNDWSDDMQDLFSDQGNKSMKITKNGVSFFDIKKNASSLEFPDVFSRYVKSFGDIYFWEKGNFHVVTKAVHAREVLSSKSYSADRASFFISRMPNLDLDLIKDFFAVVGKMMVMSDDGEHSKRRQAMAQGFEEHILERFKGKLKDSVESIISSIKGKEELDFSGEVAKKLPAIVLADLFSIPDEDREKFLQWSNIMTGFFGGASNYQNEDGIEVNEAALNLRHYFSELVELRRHSPGEDFVSLSLTGQKIQGLTDDELISQLIMMLVAGMATTTDQMNNIMFLLATHPEVQAEMRANPNLIMKGIEECKRLDPAVTFIFRVAREDTALGGQPISRGDVIFISTHLINRDLPEETRPHKLDLHRRGTHFAYGFGAHHCIGAKLARMEMQVIFEKIFTQLPPFTLNKERESIRDHYSLSFSGFKELHLRFVC